MKITYLLITVLLGFIILQNFISIILSDILDVKYIILTKDLYLVFLFSIALLYVMMKVKSFKLSRIKGLPNLDITISALFICILVYFFLLIGSSSFYAKAISFRQLMIIIIFYWLGRLYSYFNLRFLINILIYLGTIVAVFGLLEYFYLKDSFWIKLNIYQYMEQKGMGIWAYGKEGLPGNFYTYDFIHIFNQPIRRNVTLLVEPTLSGHFFSFLVIYSALYKKFLVFFIFLISLILTLSKGGIAVVILSLFFIMIKKISRLKRIIMFISFSIIFGLIGLWLYNISPSVKNHVYGLVYNVYLMLENPLGYGLGTSGNFSKLYSSDFLGSGESYFGMIVGQIGIFGGLFYLLIMKNIYSLLLISKKSVYNIIYAVSLSTLLAGFLTESAISYVGSGYIFFLLGIAYGKHVKFLREYHKIVR